MCISPTFDLKGFYLSAPKLEKIPYRFIRSEVQSSFKRAKRLVGKAKKCRQLKNCQAFLTQHSKLFAVSNLTGSISVRLTEDEKQEQAILREEYIKEFRASMRGILNSTYIQYPDGTKKKIESKKDK